MDPRWIKLNIKIDPGRAKQTEGQGETGALEGEADGLCDWGWDLEDRCGARGKEEPGRAWRMEGWSEAKGVEFCGVGRWLTDQSKARGTREPSGASGVTGHNGDERARSQGRADGLEGWGGFWELEAGGRQGIRTPRQSWWLEDLRPICATGWHGLRISRGTERTQWRQGWGTGRLWKRRREKEVEWELRRFRRCRRI